MIQKDVIRFNNYRTEINLSQLKIYKYLTDFQNCSLSTCFVILSTFLTLLCHQYIDTLFNSLLQGGTCILFYITLVAIIDSNQKYPSEKKKKIRPDRGLRYTHRVRRSARCEI